MFSMMKWIALALLLASQKGGAAWKWGSDDKEAMDQGPPLACSITDENQKDPRLKLMEYTIRGETKTTWVYVDPNITEYYQEGEAPATTRVTPKFNGLAAKFINMSNKKVRLSWEPYAGGKPNPMNLIAPFEASGTASFPGHIFTFSDLNGKILERVTIGEYPNSVVAFNPYLVEGDPETTEKNLKTLTGKEREMYQKWKDTLDFNERYTEFTGRAYLANYLRDPPRHYMWPAEKFGEQHWVESRETHFVEMPPDEEIGPLTATGVQRRMKEGAPRALQEYRDPNQQRLNMTLTVLSVAPRVFEIQNFMSETEVDHILKLAGNIVLKRSSVGDVGEGKSKAEGGETSTRTSFNSWVDRSKSPIIDAIYRRAADVMRIDEAMLRHRDKSEFPDWPTKGSLAEQLQLVHYDPKQEYTAHHDFGYSDLSENQGARFSTLLFYLNEVEEGGETSFPRWQNAEHFDRLAVKPRAGKAVLFYNQLPDGNLDDFSQHAALPVRKGDKWLINLWTWDPKYH